MSVRRGVASWLALVAFLGACTPAAPTSQPAPTSPPAATSAPANPVAATPAAPVAPAASAALTATNPAAQATASPVAQSAAVTLPSITAASKPSAASGSPFNEQAVADFYRGKNVRIIVGYTTGGNFDLWARLLARFMPKHVPGNPNIIVENMPGAGAGIAANYLFNVAPKDGTVIGTFSASLVTNQLIKAPGVEFDARQFNWIGAPMNSTLICVAAESSGVKSIEDILPPKSMQLILGGIAPGTPADDYAPILKALLNANIKLVSGYPGNAQIRAAIESGELQAYCLALDAARVQHQAWDDAGSPKYSYIAQFGLQRNPQLPNVTNVYELLKSEEDRAVLRIEFGSDQAFFPFTAPPGVPADRVAALRRAFLDTLKDPELEIETTRLKLEKDPQPGERVLQVVTDLLATPDVAVQRYKQILGR